MSESRLHRLIGDDTGEHMAFRGFANDEIISGRVVTMRLGDVAALISRSQSPSATGSSALRGEVRSRVFDEYFNHLSGETRRIPWYVASERSWRVGLGCHSMLRTSLFERLHRHRYASTPLLPESSLLL